MKKGLMFLLVLCLAMMSACTAVAQETAEPVEATPCTPAGEKEIIGVALQSLNNPLMLAFQDSFTTAFGEEYDVQVASADDDANKQATQIENFTTMCASLIFTLPVQSTSLAPKLEAAREAGVLVIVGGTEPGEAARDAVMKVDQYLLGEYGALMAKQWIDEAYPDAAEESIEIAIFASTANTDMVNRTNGLKSITEPYLKDVDGNYIDTEGNEVSAANKVDNPTYSPAVKIVFDQNVPWVPEGQTAMQNLLSTNPNVKLVLAAASPSGIGANTAIKDEYAKGATSLIQNLDEIGIFGIGLIPPDEPAALVESSLGNGVFRGAVSFGGMALANSTVELATKMLNGEEYPAVTWDPIDLGKGVDGQVMLLSVENSGVIHVPTGEWVVGNFGPPPGAGGPP